MNKIGFHVGVGGNRQGFGDYLAQLAQAGIPAVVKSVDDYGACVEALSYNPDNVVIFRMTGEGLELPDYNLSPVDAATQHWRRVKDALPAEFDRRTWLEIMNEPDKSRSEWLGEFCWHMARFMLHDGYKFAALGWSSGEPEPEQWFRYNMSQFLRLASGYPDRIAIALHEYSFSRNDIENMDGWLIGRFQHLVGACDAMGIPTPTILITEWGWEHDDIPSDVWEAMSDIAWAADLYAEYPRVLGAAIWYLGSGFGGIADKVQKLIAPVTAHTLAMGKDEKPAPLTKLLVDARGGTVVFSSPDGDQETRGLLARGSIIRPDEVGTEWVRWGNFYVARRDCVEIIATLE